MAYLNNYGQNTSTNTHRASRNDIIPSENGFTPTAPDTNSLLQTSTNIFVYANGSIVGMIQSFSVTENRTINKLQAIGYEGVVQAVPSNTNGGQLNVTRIALYESNIWNALGLTSDGKSYNPIGKKVYNGTESNGRDNDNSKNESWDEKYDLTGKDITGKSVSSRFIFKTLKDQRVPLEIQVKTKKAGSADDYFIETYIDCWLSSYSKSYTVQNITVAETAQIQYADVY